MTEDGTPTSMHYDGDVPYPPEHDGNWEDYPGPAVASPISLIELGSSTPTIQFTNQNGDLELLDHTGKRQNLDHPGQ
ncbi:hypothetical protein ACIGW8_35085 [Streptomyces sioyaensis]|uniref:hypothetical protein n=1 Tax=Streptomyces sioyaensis TaxID=67364 RepID=UPI0037D3E758